MEGMLSHRKASAVNLWLLSSPLIKGLSNLRNQHKLLGKKRICEFYAYTDQMKNKWKILILGILGSTLSGCAVDGDIQTVDANTFEQSISHEKVQLVDVRTAEEFNSGHIAEAINIDYMKPDFQTKALKVLDRKHKTYLYCRSGKRSMDAARILKRKGFHVVNLRGGIIEWQKGGKPLRKL